MNKYISTCVISLCFTPHAFGSIGSGFYATVGIGGGNVDYQQLDGFTLDYPDLYNNIVVNDELNQAVLTAFNDTAEYSDASKGTLGGRAAIGYMWDIFEGEPVQADNAIFKFNATLGLEVGYRLYETIENSFEEVEKDGTHNNVGGSPPSDGCYVDGSIVPNCFFVYENATDKIRNQAVDVSGVLRLPFTDDRRLAALLKAGVAYNFYSVETDIQIEADTSIPPSDPIPYDRTVSQTVDHNEFLFTYGVALEYMFFDNVGLSAEYNAITGSSNNADSDLIMGNLVLRM